MPLKELEREHPLLRLTEEKDRLYKTLFNALIASVLCLAMLAAAWFYMLCISSH